MKRFRILSVASEVDPFSKTGGLADVARSLPKSLVRLGHDVIIVTPYYKKIIDEKKFHLKKVFRSVPLSFPHDRTRIVSYWRGTLIKNLPVYFVSYDRYFGRKKNLYGSDFENKRFYLFCMAALKLPMLLHWKPDIIHCHDWHSGLIPEILKKQCKDDEMCAHAATVFTIHNLAFQFGHNWWEIPGKKRDAGVTPLPDLLDARAMERTNFTKRAILAADLINTVSETYAEEIMRKNYGQDLHRILKNRENKLFGVVNGIDYLDFNPARDGHIAMKYDYRKIRRKKLNKAAVQKEFNLSPEADACVIVMVSRIAEQKGFDILLPIVPAIMTLNAELVIMGDGDKEYLKELHKFERAYPGRIAVRPFEASRETSLYAGGDVSLFPSRFEPCGTGQLKSMRYGCVPVAREIGGLSDTVIDADMQHTTGNGFVFARYDAYSFLAAITRAVAHFQHHASWRDLAVRGMKQSNSWELPANEYVELYKKAIQFKLNGASVD